MRRLATVTWVILALVAPLACLDLDGLLPADPCAGTACEDVRGSTLPDGSADATDTCPPSGCASVTCNGIVCGPHERCDETASTPACTCVTGYARDGGACTWTGGPLDPGFQGTPPNAWRTDPDGPDSGVTFLPTADGGVDPGVVAFGSLCKLSGVRQDITMPPYAAAEPLALEIVAAPTNPAAIAMNAVLNGKSVSFTTSSSTAFQTFRACLGESAYGGALDFGVFRNYCGMLQLDRAAIVPDPSCPTPGTVVSPDFQSAGWAVADGAEITTTGLNGVSGRLVTVNHCSQPKLTGRFSVPSSLKTPALAMKAKGTPGHVATVGADGSRFAAIIGTGAIEDVRVCIPEHLRGVIASLELSSPARSANCGVDYATEFLFDDLSFVEEPSCESPGHVFDPSFERAVTSKVRYFFATSPEVGFNKQYDLKFTTPTALKIKGEYGGCPGESRETRATVFASVPAPPSPGAPGAPKLSFKYVTQVGYNSTVSFGALGQGLAEAAPPGGAGVRCLSRALAGKPLAIDFVVNVAACSSQGELTIDDIAIAWDPACP